MNNEVFRIVGSVLLQDEEFTNGIRRVLNEAESTTQKVAQKFQNAGSKITSVGKTMTAGLTTSIGGLVGMGVKYNIEMETLESNLSVLLGSTDAAHKRLEELRTMGAKTPFETTDLVKATQKMLAFGLDADKTNGYLQTLGDIAMGDANKLDSLTLAFSQIGASGRASMEDINQMIDQGFNPLTYVVKKTGESMSEVRDRVSEGGVSFEEIASAMKDATSEGGAFYQSMDKASETTAGRISTLKDNFGVMVGGLTNSLMPSIEKVVDKVAEWIDKFNSLDQGTKDQIVQALLLVATLGPVIIVLGSIVSGIGKLISGINNTVQGFKKFIEFSGKAFNNLKKFGSKTVEVAKSVGKMAVEIGKSAVNFGKQAVQTTIATTKLIAHKVATLAVTTAQKAMTLAQAALNFVMSLNPITLIIIAITALIAIFVTLWVKCEWFRNLWIGLWNGIIAIVKGVVDGIVAVVTFLVNLIVAIFTTWFNIITLPWRFIWENCKDIIMAVFNAIADFIGAIINTIKNIIMFIFEAIKTYFIMVFNIYKTIFMTAWNIIYTVISTVLTLIWNVIQTIFNVIVTIIQTAWNTILTVTQFVWNLIVGAITTVINTIKTIITTVFNVIVSVITTVWNTIKGVTLSVWNAITSTISNVVNGIKNTISNVFNAVKNTVTNIWNGIMNAIKKPIEKARDLVKGAIDKIKGFFNFEFKWPKLKMPHFGIKPKGWQIGDLLKGKIPSLKIDWYAKGAIFDEPTLFNTANGMKGVGEAGPEAVAPISELMKYTRLAVDGSNATLEDKLDVLISLLTKYLPLLMNKQIVLDTGELVGSISSEMDKKLGDINKRRERGN